MLVFFTFALWVFGVGKLLLEVVARDKEFSYSEEPCDTSHAGDVGEGIVVVYDDLSCNSNDKNLESVCRSEVYEHSHKLKSDDDS